MAADAHLSDDKIAVGLAGKIGLEFTPYRKEDMALNFAVGYQFTSYLKALQEGTTVVFANLSGNVKPGNGAIPDVIEDFDDDYFNSGLYININLNYR